MTLITKLLKLQILCFIFSLNLYFIVTLTTTVDDDEDDYDEDTGNIPPRKNNSKHNTPKAILRTSVTTISSTSIKYTTTSTTIKYTTATSPIPTSITITLSRIRITSSSTFTPIVKGKKAPKPYTQTALDAAKIGGLNSCKSFKCTNKLTLTEILAERRKHVLYFGVCGYKEFYITKKAFTPVTHSTGCCAAGLIPAIIETKQEIACLNEYYSKVVGWEGTIEIMTSISDYSRTQKFVNCPNNKEISADLWAPGEPNNKIGTEMCALLVLCADCSYSGIKDAACSQNARVLCQGTTEITTTSTTTESTTLTTPTAKRTIPTYSPFLLDALKISNSNSCQRFQCEKKVDEAQYPNVRSDYVIYFGDCGNKSFYVTKQEYTSLNFHTGCCYAGFYPATMETRAEFDCLNNHYIRQLGNSGELQLFSSIGDYTRKRKFVNCPSNKQISEELWAQDEPDNKEGTEMCSQLIICANCSYSGVYDVSCAVNGRTLCQHFSTSTTTSTTTTTLTPTTALTVKWKPGVKYYGPTYSPVKRAMLRDQTSCKSKIRECWPKDIPTEKQRLIKFVKLWDMVFLNECNGRLFFITKDNVMSSWNACCQAGLIPADIKSKTELDCIRANANNVTGLKGELTAFTVHRDKYLNRTFMSCLDNSMFPDELWIRGEPDNKSGTQVCALVNICSDCQEPGFSDVDCAYIDRALCQNRANDDLI